MKYHQNLPQIMLIMLEIAGEQLLATYGKAFKEQLQKLDGFVKGFAVYLKPESQPSIYDEPQNKVDILRLDEDSVEAIKQGGRPSKTDTGVQQTSI